MDSPKNTTYGQRSDSDADIGMLLYKTGKSLKDFILWIAKIIENLGKALLLGILFLVRNILWLAIGTALGVGYGLYLEKKNGYQYFSEMNVQTNFNSPRSLYSAMDYLNALISSGQKSELSKLFEITPTEASQLVAFNAEPVKSEIITSEIYKERYLEFDRTMKVRQDTFWIRTMPYSDFKESLTKFDYKIHKLSVVSTNPNIFYKLQQGILDHISKNELLQQLQKREAVSNTEEVKLLVSALGNLDSLRQAYNQRLTKGLPTLAGSNQVTVLESSPEMKIPELELYEVMLHLNEELKKARSLSLTGNEIIEVISPFNPVGRKLSFFQQNATRYAIIGFSLALIALLIIVVYRSLSAFERLNNLKRKAAKK